jgi:hypothetical protein
MTSDLPLEHISAENTISVYRRVSRRSASQFRHRAE